MEIKLIRSRICRESNLLEDVFLGTWIFLGLFPGCFPGIIDLVWE